MAKKEKQKKVKTEKVPKAKKPKKPKHLIGKKEFIFNFFSLVIMIGFGIYFGYRSLYYYSKQNRQIAADAQTLNGFIIQNSTIVSEDELGLHQDSNGYFYKGLVDNNYVLFGNEMYRIIRIQEDNTVRLISDSYVAMFPWGDTSDYQSSNLRAWFEQGENKFTGVYYRGLPDPEKFLVKTEYREDILLESDIQESEEVHEAYVTPLTVTEYIMALGKNSYLNYGRMFFLLGLSEDGSNLYIDEEGNIQTCDSTEGYGVRPVITLKANTIISGGDGTAANPYVIADSLKPNYLYSYVKLGDDMWRVFYQTTDTLRLSLDGYITVNGAETVINYSQTNSIYDIMDAANIGYYLNHTYLESLPYQNVLIDFQSFTGEISDDQDYKYFNIYNNVVTSKVSLLNVFDRIANPTLTDYYLVNMISPISSMQYVPHALGFVGESDVREGKHIVPVVSISVSSIKGGTGTKEDPYIVG